MCILLVDYLIGRSDDSLFRRQGGQLPCHLITTLSHGHDRDIAHVRERRVSGRETMAAASVASFFVFDQGPIRGRHGGRYKGDDVALEKCVYFYPEDTDEGHHP